MAYKDPEMKKQKDKEYRENNISSLRAYQKKYYLENKEKKNAESSENHRNNRERNLAKQKEYYQKHKKERKEYNEANRDKIRVADMDRYRRKMETDTVYRLKRTLRSRLHNALRGNSKTLPTLELLGCTPENLKVHLESKFKEGMTWENYGHQTWHIDHIIPCDSFDLTDIEQQRACFHYTNLQPLWSEENLSKGTTILEKERHNAIRRPREEEAEG